MEKGNQNEECTYKFAYEPFSVPDGIEAAAHRFAGECLLKGFGEYASLAVVNGFVQAITVEKDGELHYVYLLDGDWYEMVDVEGRKSEDG